MGNQRTVSHVCLFYLIAWRNTYQLGHQTIHHIGIILCLIGLAIRQQAEFYEFRVGDIVQAKQVGTCFLNGIAVSFQRIGVSTWKQLSAAMT